MGGEGIKKNKPNSKIPWGGKSKGRGGRAIQGGFRWESKEDRKIRRRRVLLSFGEPEERSGIH